MWWAHHLSFLMVCQLPDCCNVPFTTLSIMCNLGNACPLMVLLLPFCVKFHLCPSSCGPTIENTKVMRCKLLLGLLFADGSTFVTGKLEHKIYYPQMDNWEDTSCSSTGVFGLEELYWKCSNHNVKFINFKYHLSLILDSSNLQTSWSNPGND
jgi:hypothetical protein